MGVWDRDDEVDELGGPLDVEVTIVDDVELLFDGGAGKIICGYWNRRIFPSNHCYWTFTVIFSDLENCDIVKKERWAVCWLSFLFCLFSLGLKGKVKIFKDFPESCLTLKVHFFIEVNSFWVTNFLPYFDAQLAIAIIVVAELTSIHIWSPDHHFDSDFWIFWHPLNSLFYE